ncbi:MAG: hypothetical protein GX902_12005 [Lentisphaerae bacterium]|nr:hypothetical protein [Lentisphaerota bacterium]
MADLQFDLSDVPLKGQKKSKGSNNGLIFLLLLLLCSQSVLLYAVAVLKRSGEQPGAALSAEQTLELAQKLENLDLPHEAVAVWQQYLALTRPDAEKAAKLWYRIGMVQQDGRLYSEAIASYARSQALCQVEILEPEIARRTQECLEQLGQFAALRRDIRQRTDVTADGSSAAGAPEVLAEIGAWKITRADYERSLERQVEATLGMLPPGSDSSERNKRRQAMLQRLNDPKNFASQFQQFIVGELLYREARERKLHEQPQFQSFLRLSERRYLEQGLLNTLPQPAVSEAEMQFYYEKHPAEFQQEDGAAKPFGEVREQIRQTLFQQKLQESQQQLIASLIDKYDVVYHTARIPEVPEASAGEP